MPHIPEEVIEEVRQRADIVDIAGSFVTLKKRGGEYWACCPFHKEKTPSFKLSQERQGYYCFGCKAHGSVIDFVKSMVNTDFPGAIRWLADRLGIVIPESRRQGMAPDEGARLRKLHEKRQNLLNEAAARFHSLLSRPEAEVARNYLNGRGLDAQTVEHFHLGYSLDSWDALVKWANALGYEQDDLIATGLVAQQEGKNSVYDRFRGRLMFPIWNELGKVVGFSARVLDPEAKTAKYVNSPESDFFQKGQILYAFNFARSALKDFGHAIICEGQLDVIACHRAGLVNAVAAQGTAFTEMHARLLKKSVSNVILCFDADTAGGKAAERSICILNAAGFSVSVVTLPEGEDPDSIFRKGGPEGLRQVMSVTEPAIKYLFRISCLQADVNSPEGKSIIVNRVLGAIRPLPDEIVRVGHCQWLAEQMGLPKNVVINALNAMPVPNERRADYSANVRPVAPVPFFSPPQPNEQIWTMLLDLTVHFECFARDLAIQQEVLDSLPNTPLGNALNKVVIMAEEDEWSGAIDALTDSELFKDPVVGKVLLASEYAKEKAPSETLQKSYHDCVSRIKYIRLSDLILKKQSQMAAEPDEGKKRDLQAEVSRLIQDKARMKNSRHS